MEFPGLFFRWGDFSANTKQTIFKNSKARGEIPKDTPMSKTHQHHLVPLAEAKKRGIPEHVASSPVNGISMLVPDHIELHQTYTLEELADQNIGRLPLQKAMF